MNITTKQLEEVLQAVYWKQESPELPVKEWDVDSVMKAIKSELARLGIAIKVPSEEYEGK